MQSCVICGVGSWNCIQNILGAFRRAVTCSRFFIFLPDITTKRSDNYTNPTTGRNLITNCRAFRSHLTNSWPITSWSAIAGGCRGSFSQNKFAFQIKTPQPLRAESCRVLFFKSSPACLQTASRCKRLSDVSVFYPLLSFKVWSMFCWVRRALKYGRSFNPRLNRPGRLLTACYSRFILLMWILCKKSKKAKNKTIKKP